MSTSTHRREIEAAIAAERAEADAALTARATRWIEERRVEAEASDPRYYQEAGQADHRCASYARSYLLRVLASEASEAAGLLGDLYPGACAVRCADELALLVRVLEVLDLQAKKRTDAILGAHR